MAKHTTVALRHREHKDRFHQTDLSRQSNPTVPPRMTHTPDSGTCLSKWHLFMEGNLRLTMTTMGNFGNEQIVHLRGNLEHERGNIPP